MVSPFQKHTTELYSEQFSYAEKALRSLADFPKMSPTEALEFTRAANSVEDAIRSLNKILNSVD